MSRGIVYMLSGIAYAEHLAISTYSLRQHWSGNIHIWATESCRDITRRIADCKHVRATVGPIELVKARKPDMNTKPTIWRRGPYDQCVFVDADTVIEGRLDELFTDGLRLTQISNFRMNSWDPDWQIPKRQRERIKTFVGDNDEDRRRYQTWLDMNPKMINSGVLAYSPDHPVLKETQELCGRFTDKNISDQTALQYIYPFHDDVDVIDERFNWLFFYGDPKNTDVRIRHYNGSEWVRVPVIKMLYGLACKRAVAADVGGIQQWLGKYNPWLTNMA